MFNEIGFSQILEEGVGSLLILTLFCPLIAPKASAEAACILAEMDYYYFVYDWLQ